MTQPRALSYDRWSPRPDPDEAAKSKYRQELCRSYCRSAGLTIAAELYDEEVSGRLVPLGKREAGAKLLASLRKGDHVVAYDLSRLFRSSIDGQITLMEWEARGIVIHFPAQGGQSLHTGTPTGRLLVKFLLAIAEFEPENTADRTSRSMLSHQWKHGRVMGGTAPYGLEIDPNSPADEKRYRINSEEKEIRDVMFSAQRDNGKSPREIAAWLNRERVSNRKGKAWHYNSIHRILQSPPDLVAVLASWGPALAVAPVEPLLPA